MLIRKTFTCLSAAILLFSVSKTSAHEGCHIDGHSEKHKLHSFCPGDVRITEGMFLHAMEMNSKWLLSLECDRLLAGFYIEIGLEPKAPRYGGWENSGVSGHILGHYLSAISKMYAVTGDPRYKERLDYVVSELSFCQDHLGTGLVVGLPRGVELFGELERGDIRSQGFDLNEGWVPMYTLHKLFAGLIDTYYYNDNPQTWKVLSGLSEWFLNAFSPLSDEQLQKIQDAEHGGIPESMAELYNITGDKRYLDLALRLNHRAITEPLIAHIDDLPGKHANTQVPKIVGTARQYEVGGGDELLDLSDFFWKTVVHNHSYVIGGNSEAEHFGSPGWLSTRIGSSTCETCNTYNMLKLTKHLHQIDPSAERMDYYERAMYNHILASQDPNDGMICYMSPLKSGSHKTFCTPFDDFWCCVGTGIENHTRYGEFIYMADNDNNLYVNLFVPSELDWESRGATVTQSTRFPESDTVTYTLTLAKSEKFSVNLRIPYWANDDYRILVNGSEITNPATIHDGYAQVSRKWKNGDKITYIVPQKIHSEPILGDESIRAFLHGPIVLASIIDPAGPIPAIVTDDMQDAASIVRRVDGQYRFVSDATRPEQLEFIPYYSLIGAPLIVYFDHYTPDIWAKEEESIRKKQDMEAWTKEMTVSQFTLGEMQPERDHGFQGVNLRQPVEIQGRKIREAGEGGWFSFDMAVDPNVPVILNCTYWGDVFYFHNFNIYIEDEPIGYEIIHNWGHRFVDRSYKIPFELTEGKDNITIRFQALKDTTLAGPLVECSIIKQY